MYCMCVCIYIYIQRESDIQTTQSTKQNFVSFRNIFYILQHTNEYYTLLQGYNTVISCSPSIRFNESLSIFKYCLSVTNLISIQTVITRSHMILSSCMLLGMDFNRPVFSLFSVTLSTNTLYFEGFMLLARIVGTPSAIGSFTVTDNMTQTLNCNGAVSLYTLLQCLVYIQQSKNLLE